MTRQKYAFKDFSEHTAKAVGRALPISTKQSVEICSFLRNKNLQKAKDILNRVITKKTAVPFKRYNRSMGHKPGKMDVGRYPIKSSKEILDLLESVEANAQFKGLNTASLVIKHICAHKASKQMRYGRQRGRTMKRTHVEVVVEEKAEKKREEKPKEIKPIEKKEVVKEEKKVEEQPKPEVKKEQPKVVAPKAEAPKSEPKKQEENKK
jgi:large subunit ribosomal protein L22